MALSGLRFPLNINSLGRFDLAQEDEKIEQNLRRIVATQLRERWYEPNAGTVGYALLFKNTRSRDLGPVVKLISDAIIEQEPRVQAQVSLIEDDFNLDTIVIRVQYFRRDTQEFNELEVEVDAN